LHGAQHDGAAAIAAARFFDIAAAGREGCDSKRVPRASLCHVQTHIESLQARRYSAILSLV